MVLLKGRIEVLVVEARGLNNLDSNIVGNSDKSDPYCVVSAEGINGSRRIGKTFTIDDCLNPKWNYKMVVDLSQDVSALKFVVKDKDLFRSEKIGSCFLDSSQFTSVTKHYQGLLPLTNSKGRVSGSLRVQVLFTGSGMNVSSDVSVAEKFKVTADSLKTRLKDKSHRLMKHDTILSSFHLHGVLEIFLMRALNLPNLDTSILSSFKKKDVSDPYVIIMVEDSRKESWKVGTSSVKDNDLNPVWNEKFIINICHDVAVLKFVIKDKDVISAEEIGTLSFLAKDIIANPIDGEYDMNIKTKSKKRGKLVLSIKFLSVDNLTLSPEVPDCLFPLREMSNVTLYQDAHCMNLPKRIPGRFGTVNPYQRAWLDIYHTLTGAKEFIYIIGWSVNTQTALLRWGNEDTRSLGDILIQKANEGVHVCIMVWDELTSTDFNKAGAMATSDQATANFFRNTPVSVILAVRERHSKDLISTKEHFTNFCYSHHQKCIMADGPIEGERRRQIVAYIGGLDMTNGRFDTPDHPLFSTLDTDHKFDFYNNVCDTKVKYGPRQPWHDIHCRIEGPAVMDLFTNFHERWKKQGSKKTKDHGLIENEKYHYNARIPSRWSVQVFRSINSDSATLPHSTYWPGLSVKKERMFENSIQRAYIHHIRRSKKFLYMENQYFLGSSHAWHECRDTNIENLIPLEIAAHIASKIKAGDRYTAYILIPMFPEGKPAEKVIQEILHWQFRTIEMMYGRIADAILEANIEAHPQDYLLFFCLGKKEGGFSDAPSELSGHAANAFKHKRLMIYVHSKMAIFDDEYIIIGSANINDRSLSGNRDTEIAIGALQPKFMTRGAVLPDGDVAVFRKSLWAEHMGKEAPLEHDPSTLFCVNRVKQLAEDGLLSFIDQGEAPGLRHLLIYPLKVEHNGAVTARKDCPTFPDTVAKVVGARSGYIPTRLTS